MGCADLEISGNGVTRAIEYVNRANLMSDGQVRLHVECRLGRLSPLSMHHFRHDVNPPIHQVRTFHSRVKALRCRATISAFFGVPQGRQDCHQDLAACHQPRTQAHIEHRAANRAPCEPSPIHLRQVQARVPDSVLPNSIACTSVSRIVSGVHVQCELQLVVCTTRSEPFSS